MGIPTTLHRYNLADFTTHNYWGLYFQGAGVFEIDGDTVVGFPGLRLNVKVGSMPIHVSGSDNLYLLGDINGDLTPLVFCEDDSQQHPVGTPYYYGNLKMGGYVYEENNCPITQCYIFAEDDCNLTDENGCPFILN